MTVYGISSWSLCDWYSTWLRRLTNTREIKADSVLKFVYVKAKFRIVTYLHRVLQDDQILVQIKTARFVDVKTCLVII